MTIDKSLAVRSGGRMILRWFRKIDWLKRIQVLFLAAFAYPIGFWTLCEFAHAVHAKTFPIKAGTFLQRERIRRFGGIPASRYSIQLDDTGERVYAMLAGSQLHDFPDDVRVYFSGDASKEVRLAGEESPWIALLVAVLMWGIPLLLLWLYAMAGPYAV